MWENKNLPPFLLLLFNPHQSVAERKNSVPLLTAINHHFPRSWVRIHFCHPKHQQALLWCRSLLVQAAHTAREEGEKRRGEDERRGEERRGEERRGEERRGRERGEERRGEERRGKEISREREERKRDKKERRKKERKKERRKKKEKYPRGSDTN